MRAKVPATVRGTMLAWRASFHSSPEEANSGRGEKEE